MKQKTILITGCSTGIGFDAAQVLKSRGHRVIASCRREADLVRLRELGLEALLLDLNDSESIQNAFREAMEWTNNRLDVLINNAGYGQVGALEDVSRDVLRAQFETNVFGLMELTSLAIPIMRKQGSGRIINMSSILGVISMPFRGAYNASKYALEGLSDTLRLELYSSGIKVITVQPGPIESQFRDNCVDNSLNYIDMEQSYFSSQYKNMLGTYKAKKSNSSFTQPTGVATKKLIHAVESHRPKIRYPVTLPAHLFIFLKRIIPVRYFDKLFRVISNKELS